MPADTVRAVVEDVRQSDGVASAVTREHVGSADIRTRYRLAAAGESWKIVGIDRECFLCPHWPRTSSWELHLTAKGRITAIGVGAKPEIPIGVPKSPG